MDARSDRYFRQALVNLSRLFAIPIFEMSGHVIISRESDIERHMSSFSGVGLESFVNHVHLDDVVTAAVGKLARRDLIKIGEYVIQVWAARLKCILQGREVLFYLGGPRGVTLRAHVVRDKEFNWLDLSDKAFRKKEKMRIFRLTERGLFEEP